MAQCSIQYGNKWENQKIQKFWVKKHKGVATRQHKFPKLSSNSARPFVRNWAKISKLKCRVQYKNNCNDFCNEIQKYNQSLNEEVQLTSFLTRRIYTPPHDAVHIPRNHIPDITLAQYVDPILAEYNDANDELLQIAIQQSFDTHHNSTTKTVHHDNIDNTQVFYQHEFTSIDVDIMSYRKQCIKPTQPKDVSIDLKVTIQLHNVLGIHYNDIESKAHAASIQHVDRMNAHAHRSPHLSQFLRRHYTHCLYNALPYTLTECNLDMMINNESYSQFRVIPHKKTKYSVTRRSVMIDNNKYSFAASNYEQSLMTQDTSIIPIYFNKQNKTCPEQCSEHDNRRLFQIAQKCFEKCIRSNARSTGLMTDYTPQWKYNKMHYKNDTFMTSICRLKDVLSQILPIHYDIINTVLMAYIGYSEFEYVVVETTVCIPKDSKEHVTFTEQDVAVQNVAKNSIQLEGGTNYCVRYTSPFAYDTSHMTVISRDTQYSYHGVKFDCKESHFKSYVDYSKQSTKRCIKYGGCRRRSKHDMLSDGRRKQLLQLSDGVYDEQQRRKDMKRKNTRGKVRKRRNRVYLIKEIVKHPRRKRKKKYRKNVHHPQSTKQKRFKSKISKALVRRDGHWDRSRWSGYSYRPNYCYSTKFKGNWHRQCYYEHCYHYRHRGSNKNCASKVGKKK
eukprot:579028_1